MGLTRACVAVVALSVAVGCGGVVIKRDESGLNAAQKECLKKLEKRIEDVTKKLGVDLKGKTITIKLDPTLAATAETKPDLSNPNGVVVRINPSVCNLTDETANRVVGHELGHVVDLTSSPPSPTRVLYDELIRADDALKAGMADPQTAQKKKVELKKAALVAEWKYRRQLRADEERTYDKTPGQQAKLGLSDAEIARNAADKARALADIDQEMRNLEATLKTFQVSCGLVRPSPIAISLADATRLGRKRSCVAKGMCAKNIARVGLKGFCAALDVPECHLCGKCTAPAKCAPARPDMQTSVGIGVKDCKVVADPDGACGEAFELCECTMTASANASLACTCACN